MDWFNFIKWNSIIYTVYYGVNLMLDFLRTNGEFKPGPAITEYHIKGDQEIPKKIKSSDYNTNIDEMAKKEKLLESSSPIDGQIGFNAPIERQGIPLNEFIRIASKSGNEIFQSI